MAEATVRVNRSQAAVTTLRKSLAVAESEFQAIIDAGGQAWLTAGGVDATLIAQAVAARTAVVNLRAALDANDRADEKALEAFEA